MHPGDRIRDARKKAGLTQLQLAATLGVNKSAVAQWESQDPNIRVGIKLEHVIAVAKALNVPVSDLIEDKRPDVVVLRNEWQAQIIKLMTGLPLGMQQRLCMLCEQALLLQRPPEDRGDLPQDHRIVA